MLGNNEGYFDIDGHSFSRSARNIRLIGRVLYAQLVTSSGYWCDDQIAIDFVLPPPDSMPSTAPSVRFSRTDHSLQIENCCNLELRNIAGPLLIAECVAPDGGHRDSCLDLNAYLGNQDGIFDEQGENFCDSAESVHLSHRTLHARLKRVDGSLSSTSIDLSSVLCVRDGALQPRNRPASPKAEYIVLKDDEPNRDWLGDARNIRLLNKHDDQHRKWILLAQCRGRDGRFYDSYSNLDDVIGTHYDNMFNPFRLFPEENRDVENVEFKDGILTATFQRGPIFDRTSQLWDRMSVDVGDIVTNQNGALVL